jgi:hypothetical protein
MWHSIKIRQREQFMRAELRQNVSLFQSPPPSIDFEIQRSQPTPQPVRWTMSPLTSVSALRGRCLGRMGCGGRVTCNSLCSVQGSVAASSISMLMRGSFRHSRSRPIHAQLHGLSGRVDFSLIIRLRRWVNPYWSPSKGLLMAHKMKGEK